MYVALFVLHPRFGNYSEFGALLLKLPAEHFIVPFDTTIDTCRRLRTSRMVLYITGPRYRDIFGRPVVCLDGTFRENIAAVL